MSTLKGGQVRELSPQIIHYIFCFVICFWRVKSFLIWWYISQSCFTLKQLTPLHFPDFFPFQHRNLNWKRYVDAVCIFHLQICCWKLKFTDLVIYFPVLSRPKTSLPHPTPPRFCFLKRRSLHWKKFMGTVCIFYLIICCWKLKFADLVIYFPALSRPKHPLHSHPDFVSFKHRSLHWKTFMSADCVLYVIICCWKLKFTGLVIDFPALPLPKTTPPPNVSWTLTFPNNFSIFLDEFLFSVLQSKHFPPKNWSHFK